MPRPAQPQPRLIRRVPTPRELALRLPLVLTDRDQRILSAIYTHGFLTSDLIELAYFPTQQSERQSASSCAYDRLRQLWLWDFLERVVVPTTPGLGGRNPFLLASGQRSIPVVAEQLGLSSEMVRRRRLDRLNPFTIAHDLQLARLWANLRAGLHRRPGDAMRWTTERELRARRDRVRDPDMRAWLPFLPDAYLELDWAGEPTRSVLVEVDLGTLTLDRFARKVRAFELFLSGGHFARHYGQAEFHVLVLGLSESRLAHLFEVAERSVVVSRRAAYLFGSLDLLDYRCFPEARWHTLAGRETCFPTIRADGTALANPVRLGTLPNDVQGVERHV